MATRAIDCFLRLPALAAKLTLIALVAALAARIHATPTVPESCSSASTAADKEESWE